MQHKRISALIFILLAFCSLIGIGFASWNLGSAIANANTSGTITIEDIIKHNDYISLIDSNGNKTTNVDIFRFYKTGFVNDDDEIVDTGYINIYFSIDLDKCFKKFSGSSSISFYIYLNCSTATNIFNNATNLQKEISLTLDNTTSSIEDSINNQGTTSCVSFNINNTSSTATIKISYAFTIKNSDYFKNTLYEAFNDDDFNFSLSVKFTGNEEA